MTNSGVWLSTDDNITRLEVVATQEIRYSTIHPNGYILDPQNTSLSDVVGGHALLVVVDKHIDALYGVDLRGYLSRRTNCRGYLVINGSESAKNWTQVQRVCEEAIEVQLPRDGVIMAVGGGVTLDIAGFAASIFRRGVTYVRVPTSLIGLVDVGVGIKQGINVRHKKSIVGAFYPAMANVNDPTFLATLPHRHISCGLAEIIKMALIRDAGLFDLLEMHVRDLVSARFQNGAVAREVLIRSEQLMMAELQPNLFESSLRRLPDFGHTFSPAIEAASGYSINHGEAVGMDMLFSTSIAVSQGLCAKDTLDRLRNLLLAAELPLTHAVCSAELLREGLNSVRAHRAGDLNLVVPIEVGKAEFVQHVHKEEIESALEYAVGGQTANDSVVSGSRWNSSSVRSVA